MTSAEDVVAVDVTRIKSGEVGRSERSVVRSCTPVDEATDCDETTQDQCIVSLIFTRCNMVTTEAIDRPLYTHAVSMAAYSAIAKIEILCDF